MSNINLLPSNTQVNTAWTTSVPTGITTTAAAAEAALTAKKSNMGQSDFLTLFTTQLKNQDPLDPVKNEAFVAQLAQFSQLEATTNMSTSLKNFVDSQAGDLQNDYGTADELARLQQRRRQGGRYYRRPQAHLSHVRPG